MSKPARILIIDDEEAVRLTLRTALAETGWEIVGVESAEDGLATVAQGAFDMMLVDKNLPGKSGIDFLREIRKEDETVACVMLTGYASVQSAVETLQLGVDAYIQKPFDNIGTLIERLNIALEKSAKRRQALETRAAQADARTRPLKILIGMPSQTDQEWIAEQLSGNDDELTRVATTADATAAVHNSTPDLLIVDIALDRANLHSLLPEIWKMAPATTSVVVMPETPSLELVTKLIDLGVHAVVERPFQVETFQKRVAGLLRRLRVSVDRSETLDIS